MPSNTRLIGGIALGFVAASMPVAASNLVANGSFEEPVQRPAGYTLMTPGQSFSNWSVVGANGNVAPISGQYAGGGVTFPAQDGAQWLDLTGLTNTATGVQQRITTVAGQTYDLTFWVGNVVGGGWGTSSSIEVLVNGRSLGVATNSAGAGQATQVWQRYALSFVASGTSTTLAFINRDPRNDNTDGLDNVVLVPHSETVAACAQQGGGKKHKKKSSDPLAALAALASGVAAATHATGNAADKGSQVLNSMVGSSPPPGTANSPYACETVTADELAAARSGSVTNATTLPVSNETSVMAASAPATGAKASAVAAANGACCSPEVVRQLASRAQFIDVAGVRLGMPGNKVKDALKAANPSLRITVERTPPWDFAAGLSPDSTANPQKEWPVSITATAPDGSERITAGVALPPSEPVVINIYRQVTFPSGARPSVANLLASLRKKYGPESLGPDTPNSLPVFNMPGSPMLYWFFDRSGKALAGNAPLSQSVLHNANCNPEGAYIPNFTRFGGPSPQHGKLEPKQTSTPGCKDVIVMRAAATCRSADRTVCESLELAITDYPAWDNAEAATDAWIDQQRRSAVDQQKAQAEKVEVSL